MVQTQTNPNYTKLIVDALFNKDKIGFRYRRRDLYTQARSFSKGYNDFIYKIIKSGALKIKQKWNDHYVLLSDLDPAKEMKKRKKQNIFTDVSSEGLAHELGHAVDFWFGESLAFSSHVLFDGEHTLHEIFLKEFEEKHEELYVIVMKEFENIINSNVSDNAFEILTNNYKLYAELMKTPLSETKKRKRIQKILLENGFVETYYQFIKKKCFSILNKKYGPILDALSALYNFDYFCLVHHEEGYYDNNEYLITEEFFANLFEAKVTSKHTFNDYLIKYLPRSFYAFEKLFVIFYDHIQNNKRFNDVKLKKEEA